MTHNEISAMYRDVLKVIGIDPETLSLLTEEGQFWDARIHSFSEQTDGEEKSTIRLFLLLDATNALFTLGGFKWRNLE